MRKATARRALAIVLMMPRLRITTWRSASRRRDAVYEALAPVYGALRANPDAVAPAGLKAQIEESLGRFDAASATLTTALSASCTPRATPRSSVRARAGRAAARTCRRCLRRPSTSCSRSNRLHASPFGSCSSRKELADWHDLSFRPAGAVSLRAGRRCARALAVLPAEPSVDARRAEALRRSSGARRHPADLVGSAPRRRPPAHRLPVGGFPAARDRGAHRRSVRGARSWPLHRASGHSTGAPRRFGAARAPRVGLRPLQSMHTAGRRVSLPQIAADRVDILSISTVIPVEGRWRRWRAAPCSDPGQLPGLSGTTGASFIDYIIGD